MNPFTPALIVFGVLALFGLAIILLAWFGIRAALASAERGSGFPFGAFASLLLTIAFGLAMMTYYRAPIPGIGRSFTQLLTDQPIFLARQLEVTQVQRLSDRLADLYLSLEQPTVFNVSALVGYFLVALAVTAARVALVAVIAFGLARSSSSFPTGFCRELLDGARLGYRWTLLADAQCVHVMRQLNRYLCGFVLYR